MAPTLPASTPLVGQYLVAINGFIKHENEVNLADHVRLEPPFNDTYARMIEELQRVFPKGNEDALERKCSDVLTIATGRGESKDGGPVQPWTPFIKFMAQYLSYLRDVTADEDKYLETYELLSELQSRANSALNHPVLGSLMLPIVVSCAKLVCRLAIGLDNRPELIAHLRSDAAGGEDGGARETLPERAANILRQAFVTCLNDRTSGLNKEGKPEGKKRGIYTIANICLKILFQCRKTRNATQIFENIYNLSPPLSAYPKSERVTYLYYLGRFLFQSSHFYRAQLALQQAYDECPSRPDCLKQRRHILIYLISSNLIMGRFPSLALLQRPEAHGLQDRFMPIMLAIRQGNIAAFQQYLDLDAGPHVEWFLYFRLLLQLRNRCEVLVWRSLVRKTWLLSGTRFNPSSKVAPLIDLTNLVTTFTFAQKSSDSSLLPPAADRDFDGVDFSADEQDEDSHNPQTFPPSLLTPNITALESILTSLIDQGFLRGFLSHRQAKFVISGARARDGDALAAGFPAPYSVTQSKLSTAAHDEVPGWKKSAPPPGALAPGLGPGSFGPGMVVNLSGLRAVGQA